MHIFSRMFREAVICSLIINIVVVVVVVFVFAAVFAAVISIDFRCLIISLQGPNSYLRTENATCHFLIKRKLTRSTHILHWRSLSKNVNCIFYDSLCNPLRYPLTGILSMRRRNFSDFPFNIIRIYTFWRPSKMN